MSKYFWSIDEGHGGMNIHGEYMTPLTDWRGKLNAKQHEFDDGTVIYEGEVNRKIGMILKEWLDEAGIEYESVNDPVQDTSLKDRVSKIDEIYHREKENGRIAIALSIHSNKMTAKDVYRGPGQSQFTKSTVWTSVGQTMSDKVAECFYRSYERNLPDFGVAKDRGDGDNDFEADFYICRKSDGPCVLVESLFFDNLLCAKFLNSHKGQTEIAKVLFEAIKIVESIKPI